MEVFPLSSSVASFYISRKVVFSYLNLGMPHLWQWLAVVLLCPFIVFRIVTRGWNCVIKSKGRITRSAKKEILNKINVLCFLRNLHFTRMDTQLLNESKESLVYTMFFCFSSVDE
jgi:hypothetical protein